MQRAEEAFAKTGVSIASSRRGEIEEMCDKWAVASSPALLRVRAAIGVDFIGKGHRFLKMDSSVRGFLVVLRCIILFISIYIQHLFANINF